MSRILALCILVLLSACAQVPRETPFIASKKSAVELRSMQSRIVPGRSDAVMRDVLGTLHHLGYRITKVESEGNTVSATRQTMLRIGVIVQARGSEQSLVRANAVIVSPMLESQVDSPEFYSRNFFAPLGEAMHRELSLVTQDVPTPEPVRPVAERVRPVSQPAAAAGQQAPQATPATGTPSR